MEQSGKFNTFYIPKQGNSWPPKNTEADVKKCKESTQKFI